MKGKELKKKAIATELKLYDKEYEKEIVYNIKFDFNAFIELEDVYGDISTAMEEIQTGKLKAVRALVYSAIKVEDPKITLKRVGELLDLNKMEDVMEVINKALAYSMPEKSDDLVGE